jgi:hypothetical protein
MDRPGSTTLSLEEDDKVILVVLPFWLVWSAFALAQIALLTSFVLLDGCVGRPSSYIWQATDQKQGRLY